MFPAVSRLERICTKEFRDPESGLVIPKGTLVSIPVMGLHHDPQFYHNPYVFDPEGHFGPEQRKERSPYAHMPFGSGPRNCIGMRFALVESKAAVAHIVHNFLIQPNENTPLPMIGEIISVQNIPPKGLELRLTPRK